MNNNNNNIELYHAVDTQEFPLRYLHLSAISLTSDRKYAWCGTQKQFENLVKKYEWDALTLINRF